VDLTAERFGRGFRFMIRLSAPAQAGSGLALSGSMAGNWFQDYAGTVLDQFTRLNPKSRQTPVSAGSSGVVSQPIRTILGLRLTVSQPWGNGVFTPYWSLDIFKVTSALDFALKWTSPFGPNAGILRHDGIRREDSPTVNLGRGENEPVGGIVMNWRKSFGRMSDGQGDRLADDAVLGCPN
jgi:hypothetical protein